MTNTQKLAAEIAAEIDENIELALYKYDDTMETIKRIIAARIEPLVQDADRFGFVSCVLARTIGEHHDKSEWVVDYIRLFGTTFRNAIDLAMKKSDYGGGATT